MSSLEFRLVDREQKCLVICPRKFIFKFKIATKVLAEQVQALVVW